MTWERVQRFVGDSSSVGYEGRPVGKLEPFEGMKSRGSGGGGG